MKRILITGGSGQLGFELQRALCLFGELRCPGRQQLNLANPAAILAWLDAERPDVIVNAAAYTAVDHAESEPAQARALNSAAPAAMAQWAAANDALSAKRAQAVREQLAGEGVPVEKMEVAGRGEREPLVPTADEVDEPRNRRVEISIR